MSDNNIIDFKNNYSSIKRYPTGFTKLFPSLSFYAQLALELIQSGKKVSTRTFTGDDWADGSKRTLKMLETAGVIFKVEGIENILKTQGACIFASNHMSTLESFILPGIIQPLKDVTFVVKQSLLNYPYLGKVLATREPITVSRTNPKEDLAKVLQGGLERLKQGRSLVVFPQSTRGLQVNEKTFNSIAVKLAKKAGVPIIPLAIRTDAWSMHPLTKDFGPIKAELPVHFCFGEAITNIAGNGKEEQAQLLNFIRKSLNNWGLKQKDLEAQQKLQ